MSRRQKNIRVSKKNKKSESKPTPNKLKKGLTENEDYNNPTDQEKNKENIEEDEFNPSLAAMEEEIKPKIISTFNALYKDYTKLLKSQKDKLNCALNAQTYSKAKEKTYQKIVASCLNPTSKGILGLK